jgi:hypothetical protein
MALWAVAFLGSTPIGGPIAGFVAQHAGARWGLALGAFSCAAAALLGISVLRRVRRSAAPIPPLADEAVAEREDEVLEATR